MRFLIKEKVTPKLGDVKTIEKFAWIPVKVLQEVSNKNYNIWLETYISLYEFKEVERMESIDCSSYYIKEWVETHRFTAEWCGY